MLPQGLSVTYGLFSCTLLCSRVHGRLPGPSLLITKALNPLIAVFFVHGKFIILYL